MVKVVYKTILKCMIRHIKAIHIIRKINMRSTMGAPMCNSVSVYNSYCTVA